MTDAPLTPTTASDAEDRLKRELHERHEGAKRAAHHAREPIEEHLDFATVTVAYLDLASLLDRIDKLSAEVAAKDAETEAVYAAMGNSVRFMDSPDGGDPTQAEMVANMRRQLTAAEAEAAGLRERHSEREDAALAGLTSDIAREIEAHDDFDCPSGTTYVKAAHAIAARLVEKFGRARASISPRMEADNAG